MARGCPLDKLTSGAARLGISYDQHFTLLHGLIRGRFHPAPSYSASTASPTTPITAAMMPAAVDVAAAPVRLEIEAEAF